VGVGKALAAVSVETVTGEVIREIDDNKPDPLNHGY
jgi:hypothetical protein